MSREIKFRAWDEKNKVMHNDFQYIKSGDEGNDWIIFTSDKQTLDWDEQRINSKPHPFNNLYFAQQLKIEQFTGLLDKNGKEIYEGDWIAGSSWPWPVQVCWTSDRAHFGWMKQNEKGGGAFGGFEELMEDSPRCHDGIYEVEVIGHIHETPAEGAKP